MGNKYQDKFQELLMRYRDNGFRDHSAVLDFLCERDKMLGDTNTRSSGYEIYHYLKKIKCDSDFYDKLFYELEKKRRGEFERKKW